MAGHASTDHENTTVFSCARNVLRHTDQVHELVGKVIAILIDDRHIGQRTLCQEDLDATPGGHPLIFSWQVPEDEALIVTVTPPATQSLAAPGLHSAPLSVTAKPPRTPSNRAAPQVET